MPLRCLRYFSVVIFIFIMAESMMAGELSVLLSGARSAGMGNAALAHADVFAIYNNQAGLAFVERPVAAINYENRYLLPDMSVAAALFAMPCGRAGVAGVSVNSFGNMSYNEANVGIAYGKRLGERFAVGAKVDYLRISIDGYGWAGAIVAQAGVLSCPVDGLWLGAHVYNFTYSKFMSVNYDEMLPMTFNVGGSYRIIDDVVFAMQCGFHSGSSMRVNAGVEYVLLSALALRVGAMLKPLSLAAGAGYTMYGITIDFALTRHEALGYSPQVSVVYTFGK
jgi:hypothetical protein